MKAFDEGVEQYLKGGQRNAMPVASLHARGVPCGVRVAMHAVKRTKARKDPLEQLLPRSTKMTKMTKMTKTQSCTLSLVCETYADQAEHPRWDWIERAGMTMPITRNPFDRRP